MKTMEERKKKDVTFLRKKKKMKRKRCYHINIRRWRRDIFSSEVETGMGIV